MRTTSGPRLEPSEHKPECTLPGMAWQAQLGRYPRRGVCLGCGAVEIRRPIGPGGAGDPMTAPIPGVTA